MGIAGKFVFTTLDATAIEEQLGTVGKRVLDSVRVEILPATVVVRRATANAVSYTGATPVFVDSELETWNLDPTKLGPKNYLLRGSNAKKVPIDQQVPAGIEEGHVERRRSVPVGGGAVAQLPKLVVTPDHQCAITAQRRAV